MNSEASIGVGTVLGRRYALQRPIGSGGFGTVWHALDQRVGRPVAVKTLQQLEDSVVQSFRREAGLLGSVSSPHIVRVLDAELEGPTPYLVMELLDGPSIRHQLAARGPMSVEFALGVVHELLLGLCALHRRAIVHLDIKPANVVLSPNGTKLIDFGISRPGAIDRWDSSMLKGTPPYLAPELLTKQEPDVRTDLYGVGLLLYEMLSGKPAFDGTKPVAAVLADVREGRRTPLRIHCPWLSVTVTAFVRTALATDPEDRFADAEEMLAALDLVRRSETDQASSRPPTAHVPWPRIAARVAVSRVEALMANVRVRQRFLRRGGRARFFDDIRLKPWVSLSEYCRLLDSAYAVIGQTALAEITRARIVEESREGPFVEAARRSRDELGALLSGYWKTAFRDAGGVRVSNDSRGLRLTIVGASSQFRNSLGWRTALTGSLIGVLEVAGLSGSVRLREEDGVVSWFMDLDGGPSRFQLDDVKPTHRAEELIGGRYRSLRPLGSGAFGQVWEAHDTHLDRSVAIKWVDEGVDSAALRERASLLAAVRSNHVVRVLDLESADDRPFLVMELANGPTLATVLGDVLPFESVCALGKDALGGLAAMHSVGAVHGSVSPSSLLLSHDHGERRLKWIGFDIGEPSRLPPGYAAPELVRGSAPTTQSDVFALGAILFQLLSGQLPFPPSHHGDARELRKAMEETPWIVVSTLGRIPQRVSPVLERALTPDPRDRYRDAGEMRDACASVFA